MNAALDIFFKLIRRVTKRMHWMRLIVLAQENSLFSSVTHACPPRVDRGGGGPERGLGGGGREKGRVKIEGRGGGLLPAANTCDASEELGRGGEK